MKTGHETYLEHREEFKAALVSAAHKALAQLGDRVKDLEMFPQEKQQAAKAA